MIQSQSERSTSSNIRRRTVQEHLQEFQRLWLRALGLGLQHLPPLNWGRGKFNGGQVLEGYLAVRVFSRATGTSAPYGDTAHERDAAQQEGLGRDPAVQGTKIWVLAGWSHGVGDRSEPEIFPSDAPGRNAWPLFSAPEP